MSIKYQIKKNMFTKLYEDGSTLELNLVSWYEKEPKLDLRRWKTTYGNKIPLKGLTLTQEDLDELKLVL